MRFVTALLLIVLIQPTSRAQNFDHEIVLANETLSGVISGFEGALESLNDVNPKKKGDYIGYSQFSQQMLNDLEAEFGEVEKALKEKKKRMISDPTMEANHTKATELVGTIKENFESLKKELKTFENKGGAEQKEIVKTSFHTIQDNCEILTKKMHTLSVL